jgi:diguanylate cyclase (GGDEF)-like protein
MALAGKELTLKIAEGRNFCMEKKSATSNAPIKLILLAALGCFLFTVGGGFYLFRTTRDLEAAGKWVEHTQEVQLSIQSASSLIQSIDFENRLYRLTHNEDTLVLSQRNAIQLHTTIIHLRNLVSDNSGQLSNLDALDSCSLALSRAVGKTTPELAEATTPLLRCRQVLSVMANQERELLKERDELTRRRSQITAVTEAALATFCFLILIGLFALMLRDAILRNRMAQVADRTNQELNDSVQILKDHARDAQLLATARDDLQLCTDIQQVYRSAAFRFSELLPGTDGSLCIINSSRNMVENVASWSANQTGPRVTEIFPPDNCCGLRSGQLRWYGPGASQIHCDHFIGKPVERYLCLPLVAHGATLGILFVACPDETTQNIVEARMGGVRQLVQLTAMALASLQMRKKLEHQSVRDSLTGLFNRHFLEIALERELARAVRRKSSLAVLMIDIDHFKRLNDQFGHAAGDAVLKEVAKVFSSNIRTEDLACRYGGEEFTIILPDITPENALKRAQVIREAVASLRTELENDLYSSVTISIGGAIFPQDGQSSELLLRHADASLYRAKHEGRNRVVMNLHSEVAATLS